MMCPRWADAVRADSQLAALRWRGVRTVIELTERDLSHDPAELPAHRWTSRTSPPRARGTTRDSPTRNLVVVSPHVAAATLAKERPDPLPDEGRAFDDVLTHELAADATAGVPGR